jgi:hypothetical protein
MGEEVKMVLGDRLRLDSGARFEEAVSLAIELRELGFSQHAIEFELCRYHGYAKAAATRIVRTAAARDA